MTTILFKSHIYNIQLNIMYIFPYRGWPCQLTDGRTVQPRIARGRRPKAKDREIGRYARNHSRPRSARRAGVPAFDIPSFVCSATARRKSAPRYQQHGCGRSPPLLKGFFKMFFFKHRIRHQHQQHQYLDLSFVEKHLQLWQGEMSAK